MAWKKCRYCGQPTLPKGRKKKPGEFNHARGCPYSRKKPAKSKGSSERRNHGVRTQAAQVEALTKERDELAADFNHFKTVELRRHVEGHVICMKQRDAAEAKVSDRDRTIAQMRGALLDAREGCIAAYDAMLAFPDKAPSIRATLRKGIEGADSLGVNYGAAFFPAPASPAVDAGGTERVALPDNRFFEP